tara:strand:- start:677 stop:1819 length:1143 start_codon:yes stop_codon:yes gene_type:complete
MLPRIAAVKAQADQQIIGAIQSGLEKRKERIEKKEKNDLNIKLLDQIIKKDKRNKIVPPDVTAEELAKYVPLEETIKYSQAIGTINQGLRQQRRLRKAAEGLISNIPGIDEATKRRLARANPEAAIKLGIEAQQGKDLNYELKQIGDKLYRVNIDTNEATPVTERVTTPGSSQGVDLGGRPVSQIDPATGKPVTSAPTTKDAPLIVPPSPADIKAKRELQTKDILNLYRSQARTGPVDIAGIAKQLKISEPVVRGIIEENLTKIRSEAFSKLQEMEKSFPGITEYVGKLASIDPSKGQPQGSGFLGLTGKEYEASDFGDVEAIEKFNVFLRANPEILRIYGVPESTIADIMRLESQLTNELSTKTRYSVQEIPDIIRLGY